MKKTFFLLFIAVLSYGQNGSDPNRASNYEFGSNLYSLTNFMLSTSRATGKDYYSYDQNFLSRVFVKKHLNKNVIRVSFDYNKKIINEEVTTGPFYYKDNGELQQGEFRLGYEREFSSKKIIPFLCSDLGFSYSEANGLSTAYGDFSRYQNREYLIKTDRYFANVGVGFKIKITRNILLTYEGGIQYGLYHSKNHRNNPYNQEMYGKFHSFNPVKSVGLSVAFK